MNQILSLEEHIHYFKITFCVLLLKFLINNSSIGPGIQYGLILIMRPTFVKGGKQKNVQAKNQPHINQVL